MTWDNSCAGPMPSCLHSNLLLAGILFLDLFPLMQNKSCNSMVEHPLYHRQKVLDLVPLGTIVKALFEATDLLLIFVLH